MPQTALQACALYRWPEQATEADAAGFHRDDLAVAGETAEGDEHADEQRHRNGDAQRLRNKRREYADDDVP